MDHLQTPAQLLEVQSRLRARRTAPHRIVVCGGTGCRASGAEAVIAAMRQAIRRRRAGADIDLMVSGCHGFCQRGPVVITEPEGLFCQGVGKQDARRDAEEIVRAVLAGEPPAQRLQYDDPESGRRIAHHAEIPFYARQQRIALRHNGRIDPTSIEDYLAAGGYAGLAKAIAMEPERILDEITRSGLRGRGGAGFPTGPKWKFCREAPGHGVRYVICNGDEGDPGAFMDRSIMEANPHGVLEGMILGALAIGRGRGPMEGYIYVRAEYPLAVRHMTLAVEAAREAGLLGSGILGTDFSFDLHVKQGAGAFVCGEETALMASIEGKRGMPRSRPPFPAQSGLFGRPTNINNVETWVNVPEILVRGGDWYASIGTERSKGTKVFSLVGKVRNNGLIEVPMGMTLREIVYDIGGGVLHGRKLKAVQTGGPSGGCIPAERMDLPVDYERLAEAGSIMGSGGLVVMDEETCAVDVARYFLQFTESESCGKCVPCRLGTRQLRLTLEELCAGRGSEQDIALLRDLGNAVRKGSLCGLGQTAPNPVLTTLHYFEDEYLEHVRDRRCSAGVCADLTLAPCVNRCPAEVDVPAYVSLVAEGRTAEALAVHLDRNPFPSVCGRVCPAFCETRCRRTTLDGQPVSIRAVKRFMADQGLEPRLVPLDRPAAERKSVGIVGAGPAGLTAAFFLRRLGHEVTVYEATKEPGGMMRWGIPSYRLVRKELARDVRRIERLGVTIRTGWKLGGTHTVAGLRKKHDAVFLSLGAWDDLALRIPSEDSAGVRSGIDFLRRAAEEKIARLSGDAVVIGGGNTAIDAARTALRLGASSVTVAYRRTKAEMPAQPEEIAEAEEEGVRFEFLAAPMEVLTDGQDGKRHARALRLQRMKLGPFDSSGRRRPVPAEGEFFELPCRHLFRAVGQRPTLPAEGPAARKNGTVVADRWSLSTDLDGIFAGGDAVLGPATVVEAIGQGRRAAEAMERYLNPASVVNFPWRAKRALDTKFDPEAPPAKDKRGPAPKADPGKRAQGFFEVERTLGAAAAKREARRCLRCDYGKECPEPGGRPAAAGALSECSDSKGTTKTTGCTCEERRAP
ncbi:MAG: FAD-dependent oxidoreductase [Deltaproteobacteria bacterium]|nr:FAD-dependent oxidoreductase [Deltaproteobacteria bacterium]